MGFFSNIFVKNKDNNSDLNNIYRIIGKAVGMMFQDLKAYNFEKNDIEKFLDSRYLDHIVMDSEWLKWVDQFSTGDVITYRLNFKDDEKNILAYFEQFSNSPIANISMEMKTNQSLYYFLNNGLNENDLTIDAKEYLLGLEECGFRNRFPS